MVSGYPFDLFCEIRPSRSRLSCALRRRWSSYLAFRALATSLCTLSMVGWRLDVHGYPSAMGRYPWSSHRWLRPVSTTFYKQCGRILTHFAFVYSAFRQARTAAHNQVRAASAVSLKTSLSEDRPLGPLRWRRCRTNFDSLSLGRNRQP